MAESIIIEFTDQSDSRPVFLFSKKNKEELKEKSLDAIDKAMSSIVDVSKKITDTIKTIDSKPDKADICFGINFDVEVGAIIAKVGTSASISVNLHWENLKQTKNLRS